MYIPLLLILVPMVACHYHKDYHRDDVRDDNYSNDNHENYRYDNNDDGDITDDGYGSSYNNEVYQQTTWPRHSITPKNNPLKLNSDVHPPLRRPSWIMDLFHKLAKQAMYQTPEKTINLKVSGKVELVKSYKDTDSPHGSHWRKGPWSHHGHGWMKKYMMDEHTKKIWFDHIIKLHNKLHELEDKYHHDDDDNDDDNDDEDGGSEEENIFDDDDITESKHHSRLTCPFWITNQFLKLCKCPTINNTLERVLEHPLEKFPKDPMQAFNNTPGMKELETGDMSALMTKIENDMKPSDLKKLFYAGMIRSLCATAKSFIKGAEDFERKIKERARARLAASEVNKVFVDGIAKRPAGNPPTV